MSYILDALKKSEQDRGKGAVPGVQTVHSSSLNYHQEKRSVWPWFLAVLVAINVENISTRRIQSTEEVLHVQIHWIESFVSRTKISPAVYIIVRCVSKNRHNHYRDQCN